MKFNTILTSALLANLIAAAPIRTVIVTAYTTVLVDSKGNTQVDPNAVAQPTQTPDAVEPQPAAVETTPVVKAAEPTTEAATTEQANGGFFDALFNNQDTTSTSVEAPAPTTPATTEAAPTSSTPVAEPSTSSTSAAQPTGALNSGEGTFYSTGLGSCGVTSSDSDYIIAISHELYDQHTVGGNPNNNDLCGKKIRAFYNGNSVDVTVVDRCEGCAYNDLDFSPSAFSQLASQSLGRIDITWEWLD
ncbi:pi Papain inhibitor [Candida maltosa Xu316]